MKRIIAIFLTAVLCFSCLSAWAAMPTMQDMINAQKAGDWDGLEALIRTEAVADPALKQEATITVGDVPQGKMNKDLFGIHATISHYGDEFFKANTNELTDGYQYLADELADFPVVRIIWQANMMESIKPLKERTYTYHTETGEYLFPDVDMGPVEFIKTMYAINPDIKFIMALPIWGQTPEESNQVIHFLLDEKEESEWGALRASLGIEEPIELFGLELGNEVYFTANYNYTGNEEEGAGSDDGSSDSSVDEATQIAHAEKKVKEYTDRCIEHIDAIHADFPEVDFYPCVSGNHNSRIYADPWTKGIAKELDSRIAGLTYHDYYNNPGNTDGEFAEKDHIQKTYMSVAGHPVKFIMTEHGIWSSGNTVYRRSHYAALTEAAYFHDIAWREDVLLANYHHLTGVHWSAFRRFGDSYAQDSINYVYRLYLEKLGEYRLNTHISNDDNYFSVLATKRDNGQVVLAMVNGRQDREFDLTFNFTQDYDLVYESIYTAPNNMSFMDNEDVTDIFRVTERELDVKNATSYTMPNKSVVFLTFEPHHETEVLFEETFDTYETMENPVELSNAEKEKTLTGDWVLTRVNDTGIYSSNVSAKIIDGFPAVENKKLNMPNSTYCTNTDSNLVVAERRNIGDVLEGDFKLDYEVTKDSVMYGSGIRFMVHNNGKNYYQLWLGGASEKVTWTFDKVIDGTSVAHMDGEEVPKYNADPGGYLHNDQWVRIKKEGNTISWDICGKRFANHPYLASASYVDTEPFSVAGEKPTFAFSANRGGAVDVSFDDVVISRIQTEERAHAQVEKAVYAPREIPVVEKDTQSTDAFVTVGEPDSVLYAKISGTTENGVMTLSNALPVRKLVNNGETTAKVYVSVDNYSYHQLAELAPGEHFANTLTDKAYRYIKTEGGAVSAYTTLADRMPLAPMLDMPELLARIDGEDAADATFAVSDKAIARVEKKVFYPVANGQVAVTATAARGTYTEEVTVKDFTIFKEDFASYANTELISMPLGYAVRGKELGGNWKLWGVGGTLSGNPTAKMENGALYLSGAAQPAYGTNVGYVTYDAPLQNLGEDYTISFKGNKVSTTSGMGIRFHMHDDGKSYYQLTICGVSESPYHVWRFDKVEKGVVQANATVTGPTFERYNADNNGPMTGEFTASVRVNKGEISWTINGKRYISHAYSDGGSYTDLDFCDVSLEDVRFGFAVSCNFNGHSRLCVFDDIRVCGRTVQDVVVEPTEGGKYVFVNNGGLQSKDRLYQAFLKGGLLQDITTYEAEAFQNQNYATLFVPKAETEGTRILIWDENMKPKDEVYAK